MISHNDVVAARLQMFCIAANYSYAHDAEQEVEEVLYPPKSENKCFNRLLYNYTYNRITLTLAKLYTARHTSNAN